jgi:hypothetical protein
MRILALSAALAVAALSGFATPAAADPWKDEGGHGRWRYERSDYRDRDHWRERRMHRFHGERRHRYVSRYRYSYPAYGFYRERPIRRMYRGHHHHPAYGYYRY